MASSYTTNFSIEKMATGDQSGTWGTTTNHNFDILDRIASYKAVAITTNADTHTLTVREASPGSGTENLQDGMYRVIKFTGALDSNCTVTIAPNSAAAFFIFINATTDSGSSGPYSLILTQGSGANITIGNGKCAVVYCDGAGSGAAIVDALSDLQITDDLSLASDSAVINMGADDDITITHVADTGLKLKQAGDTGDDKPFVLTLQTGELDIAQDDVLGQIDFQAPDEATGTDAILVAAGISAISEGDFSSSSNATKLSFKTGASEAATEKMYITSTGNVNMKNTATGDDTPMTLTLQTGETDIAAADKLGVINFQAPDEGTGTDATLVAAGIEAVSEGDFSSSNNATKLSFKTAASEAAAEKASLSSTGVFTATSFTGSGAGLTAGTTPITTLDIDGGTDIGEAIVDADLFIVDNGAGGTNRKTAASRLKTYIGGGGAWNVIGTTDFDDSATSATFTGINNTYDVYCLTWSAIVNATDDQDVRMRLGTSSGMITSSWYTFNVTNQTFASTTFNNSAYATAQTSANLALVGNGTDTDEGLCGQLWLYVPQDASTRPYWTWQYVHTDYTGTNRYGYGAGAGNDEQTLDRLQFYNYSGSNIASGRATLYGIAHS